MVDIDDWLLVGRKRTTTEKFSIKKSRAEAVSVGVVLNHSEDARFVVGTRVVVLGFGLRKRVPCVVMVKGKNVSVVC